VTIDWRRESWLGFAIFVAAGVLLGLVGRRSRTLKAALMFLPPTAAAVPLLYYVIEGSVSECSGAGATFRCVEVTYASSWDASAWILVGAVILLTLAPGLSAFIRNALPSVLVAIGLPVLFAIYPVFLWSWVPAWAFVLAAAIAGPPSREATPKEVETKLAR
jgi:hypothetical protein